LVGLKVGYSMVLIKLVSAYVSVRHVTHHVTDEPTIKVY